MEHAGAAETHGASFFQVAIDFDGLFPENRFGSKWVVIMMEAVDANFESMVRQVLAQCCGNRVIPGNKIERRSETPTFFDWTRYLRSQICSGLGTRNLKV